MEYEYDYDLSPAHPFTNEKSGGANAVSSLLPQSVVANPLVPPTQSFNAMDNVVWQNGNPYQPKPSDERSKALMKEINKSKQPTGNRSFRDVLGSIRNTNKENIKQRSPPIDFTRPPSPQPVQKEPSPEVIDLDSPPKEQDTIKSSSAPNATFTNMTRSFKELLEKGNKTRITGSQWYPPIESPKESGLPKLKPRRLDTRRTSPSNTVARRTSPSNTVSLRASPSKDSVEPGVATLGTGDLAALARRKGQTQLPPTSSVPTGIRRLPSNQDYGIFPSLPLKSSSKVKKTFSLNLL